MIPHSTTVDQVQVRSVAKRIARALIDSTTTTPSIELEILRELREAARMNPAAAQIEDQLRIGVTYSPIHALIESALAGDIELRSDYREIQRQSLGAISSGSNGGSLGMVH